MHLIGTDNWQRLFGLRPVPGSRAARPWPASLLLVFALLTLGTMIQVETGEYASLPGVLAIAVASACIGVLLASWWLLLDDSPSRRRWSAHPEVVAALQRVSEALNENVKEREIHELVAACALEITDAALCRLTLSTGATLRLDPSGAKWLGINSSGPHHLDLSPKQSKGRPLRVQLTSLGEELGTLELWPKPGHSLGRTEESRLQSFCREAAAAVRSASLLAAIRVQTTALQASATDPRWWQDHLDALARTHEELDETKSILGNTYMATLEALANAVDARDPYTYGHCRRVAQLASQLGTEMGMSDSSLRTLEQAALLHDIGKLGIPDSTLLKTAPLNEGDIATIRHHPELGFRMLSALHFLRRALPAIRYHHERFDGTGYPYGLAGDQIPLMARILAVADAYDAITSDRPYRLGRSTSHALAELAKCAGSHFDPVIVHALLHVMAHTDQSHSSTDETVVLDYWREAARNKIAH